MFKFGNVDEYYWTTIFREVELRRLETILHAASNIKSGISAFDKKTSYWVECSTRHKHIHFHTSMNDGEYTEYDFHIDTKNGTVLFTDKKNNHIFLDSKADKLIVNINKDIIANAGTSFTVNSPTIVLNGNVTITGDTTINKNLQVDLNIHANGTIIDDSGNTNHHGH